MALASAVSRLHPTLPQLHRIETQHTLRGFFGFVSVSFSFADFDRERESFRGLPESWRLVYINYINLSQDKYLEVY